MSSASGRTSRASVISSGLPAEAILAGRAPLVSKARSAAVTSPASPAAGPSIRATRSRSFSAGSGLPAEALLAGRRSVELKARAPAASTSPPEAPAAASSVRVSRSRSFSSGSGLPAEAILAGRRSVELKARAPAAATAPTSVLPPAATTRPRSFTAAHAAEFERAYRQSQIGTSTPALPRTYTPTSELVRAASVRTANSSRHDDRPPSSLDLLSAHHLPAAHHAVVAPSHPRRHSMAESSYYARSTPVLDEKRSRPTIDHDALERLIHQADDYESSVSVLGMRFGTNDLVRASFPCIGPWLAHFYADDLSEGAEKLDVPNGVTERMHEDARCLCCLSTWTCWVGICIGGCIKRKRSPSAMLRTYRSVVQNPKLCASRFTLKSR